MSKEHWWNCNDTRNLSTQMNTYVSAFILSIPIGVTFTMCIDISNHTQHTPCDRVLSGQTINDHKECVVWKWKYQYTLPQCHFVPHNSHMEWPGMEGQPLVIHQ